MPKGSRSQERGANAIRSEESVKIRKEEWEQHASTRRFLIRLIGQTEQRFATLALVLLDNSLTECERCSPRSVLLTIKLHCGIYPYLVDSGKVADEEYFLAIYSVLL